MPRHVLVRLLAVVTALGLAGCDDLFPSYHHVYVKNKTDEVIFFSESAGMSHARGIAPGETKDFYIAYHDTTDEDDWFPPPDYEPVYLMLGDIIVTEMVDVNSIASSIYCDYAFFGL